MDRAYLLQHEQSPPGNVKVIGIYSSEHEAQAAIERLRHQPGFSGHPDGFRIDPYPINHDHWAEGFVRR